MNIKINELDLTLQSRFSMNKEKIEEYAAEMKDGIVFDPIKVIDTRDGKFLVDGYHRVEATKRLGLDEIAAEVVPGTKVVALKEAIAANAKHGIQRTNEDKLHALQMAWENREQLFACSNPTCREIAEIVKVSKTFVNDFIKNIRLSAADKSEKEGENEPTAEENEAFVSPQKQAALLKMKVDIYGTPIPEKLLPVFAAALPREATRHLRKASKLIKRAYKMADVNFPAADQRAVAFLTNLEEHLKRHAAHCVCRACLGKGCDTCHKLGFITPAIYDRLPPELKAMKK